MSVRLWAKWLWVPVPLQSLHKRFEEICIKKFALLTNYVAPSVYEYVADCDKYESAITVLQEGHVKPQNEIYARHVLTKRRQKMNKSMETYFQILKCLSKDCNFAAMTAEQHRQSYIRNAFINGYIKKTRQRLL